MIPCSTTLSTTTRFHLRRDGERRTLCGRDAQIDLLQNDEHVVDCAVCKVVLMQIEKGRAKLRRAR